MEIETKAASLDTLSVTIKALHVNNKLMTLAVFRQLETCQLYELNGDINKALELWGYVNYNIKDEGNYWIVASKNGILYRCNAYCNNFESTIKIKSEQRKINDKIQANKKTIDDYKNWSIGKSIEEIKRYKKWIEECEHNINKLNNELEISNEELEDTENYLKSFNNLSNLTQLFIAV